MWNRGSRETWITVNGMCHMYLTLKRTNFADKKKKLAHTHVATSNTCMLSQRTQMEKDIGTYPPLSDTI